MAVDFNAEPSPEGLLLAAQLRREQRHRDMTLDDGTIEAHEQGHEVTGQVHQREAVAGPQTPAAETEAAERRAAAEPAPEDRLATEPDSAPRRTTGPSFTARLEALAFASSSRPRQSDRQR